MTKIGMIGTGAIARVHLDAWRALPVELVGHYDILPAAARRASDEYGGRVYDSLDALLADVDLVDICTPATAHRECVLAAAAAGRAVICEKPLARRLADAEAIVSACEEAGVPLYVAHVVRFFAEYARAKEVVDRGAIGTPGVIRTVRAGSFPRPGNTFSSDFYRNFDLSGGVILDVAIHDIDFQRWVCGEVERVYARGLTFAGEPDRDHTLITLRFAGGAVGHIEASWAHPAGVWRTRLEIAGDRGLIEWDSLEPPPVLAYYASPEGRPAERSSSSPLAVLDTPYTAELAHFVACFERGEPPLVTARDALMAVKIALAAIESERRNQPVELTTFQEVLP